MKLFVLRPEARKRDVDAALGELARQAAALTTPPLPLPHVLIPARVHRTERAVFLIRRVLRSAAPFCVPPFFF